MMVCPSVLWTCATCRELAELVRTEDQSLWCSNCGGASGSFTVGSPTQRIRWRLVERAEIKALSKAYKARAGGQGVIV